MNISYIVVFHNDFSSVFNFDNGYGLKGMKTPKSYMTRQSCVTIKGFNFMFFGFLIYPLKHGEIKNDFGYLEGVGTISNPTLPC